MNKETIETAVKFGVCLPETAKELNWQTETIYCYAYPPMCKATLMQTQDAFTCGYDCDFAPQMHEIACEMPFHILRDINKRKTGYREHLKPYFLLSKTISPKNIQGEAVCVLGYFYPEYRNEYEDMSVYVYFNSYHYAEAYAKLYIKLREAGLLGKEVTNE